MAIELNEVQFRYPNQTQPVLSIPNWSLADGERAFIHGPSGGGKSTFLNVLSGLLAVNSGSVSILGQRIDQLSIRQKDRFRAEHIGFVFQQFNLIPYLDAIDNIRLAGHFSRKKRSASLENEIKDLLSELNITEREWNVAARNLSIGQQQRIAIARALINKPQILIADEPTSSLDQANRDGFMSLLMNIVAEHQITLLFVSHDMGLSQYFNRVEALGDINQLEGGA